jgi:Transglycosylase-like domain
MRNIPSILASAIMLASQVTNLLPTLVTAQSNVQTVSAGNNETKIELHIDSPAALVSTIKQPNIETDMLTPIRAYQAEVTRVAAVKAAELASVAAARQASLAAARRKASVVTASVAASPVGQALSMAQITFLGNCESAMTWNRNSGNGFYGAFQFTIPTWNAMQTGYSRADYAPIEVQIAAVQRLLSRSSIHTQFPGCARKMSAAGLI